MWGFWKGYVLQALRVPAESTFISLESLIRLPGGELEQIQFLLGSAQDLKHALNDTLRS